MRQIGRQISVIPSAKYCWSGSLLRLANGSTTIDKRGATSGWPMEVVAAAVPTVWRKGGKLVMVGLYGGACPISTVLFPFKMMTIEGSYVGTLDDLKELLALVQAGKVPPIPIETRPADQASAALSDLKSGGKVRGRVVLRHQ